VHEVTSASIDQVIYSVCNLESILYCHQTFLFHAWLNPGFCLLRDAKLFIHKLDYQRRLHLMCIGGIHMRDLAKNAGHYIVNFGINKWPQKSALSGFTSAF
jgi:hypothetical protein